MRISVAFHNATILVPCGDGSCTVSELINKAITRYKKHVNKVRRDHFTVNILPSETLLWPSTSCPRKHCCFYLSYILL
jgi:hypothetical protein